LYSYIGARIGIERTRLSDDETNHQETDYSPAILELVGMKLFLIKNVALFAKWKRTTAWHTCDYNGASLPFRYSER
jgi:hypothetical protein